jgi:hypothetical protein
MFSMFRKWVGRGAGFRDFLRLPSVKENRSNRRTLPFPEIRDVDPSNPRGVGKAKAGHKPAFSLQESWACGRPKVMKRPSIRQLLSVEAPPSPLSSRAANLPAAS